VAISAWASEGVGEAEEFGPAHQVGGGQEGFQPRDVFLPATAGTITQARVLGVADAVFHASVLPMVEFQPGGLPRDDLCRR
jgi:hypothetical protein